MCVAMVVVLCGWVSSRQPVNHSFQDIGVSFVEEAKGVVRVGWSGFKKKKKKEKYPLTELWDGEDWITILK